MEWEGVGGVPRIQLDGQGKGRWPDLGPQPHKEQRSGCRACPCWRPPQGPSSLLGMKAGSGLSQELPRGPARSPPRAPPSADVPPLGFQNGSQVPSRRPRRPGPAPSKGVAPGPQDWVYWPTRSSAHWHRGYLPQPRPPCQDPGHECI